jgi:hypothetical protein
MVLRDRPEVTKLWGPPLTSTRIGAYEPESNLDAGAPQAPRIVAMSTSLTFFDLGLRRAATEQRRR